MAHADALIDGTPFPDDALPFLARVLRSCGFIVCSHTADCIVLRMPVRAELSATDHGSLLGDIYIVFSSQFPGLVTARVHRDVMSRRDGCVHHHVRRLPVTCRLATLDQTMQVVLDSRRIAYAENCLDSSGWACVRANASQLCPGHTCEDEPVLTDMMRAMNMSSSSSSRKVK